MVNWQLIGRATARYTVGYAGAIALLVLVLTRSEVLLLVLMGAGLAGIVFAFGAETRSQSLNSEALSGEVTVMVSGNFDPLKAQEAHTQPWNLKALFLGVGLIVFGFLGMIVAGGV